MTNTATKEKSLENLLAQELRALDSQSLQARDLQFNQALKELLSHYSFSAATAAAILRATPADATIPGEPAPAAHDRNTSLKVFRNPYTRETLKTDSFSHQTLDEWRRRHGSVIVQTWRIK